MTTERGQNIKKITDRSRENKNIRPTFAPRERTLRGIKTPEDRRIPGRAKTTVSSRDPATSPRRIASPHPAAVKPPEAAKSPLEAVAGKPPARRPENKPISRVMPDTPSHLNKRKVSKAKSAVKKQSEKTPKAAESDNPYPDKYIWISLFLIFIAGFLLISCVSFLFYWDADQSVSQWGGLMRNVHQDALNWGGRIGAMLSGCIVGKWFGLFGILLPVTIFIIALKVLHIPRLRLRRGISSCLLFMIVGSVALGHFAGRNPEVFGSGWGGEMGIYSAEWLQAIIGFEGTSLLMALLIFGTIYFTSSEPIRNFIDLVSAYIMKLKEHQRIRRERNEMHRRELMAEASARLAAQRAAARIEPAVGESVPESGEEPTKETVGEPSVKSEFTNYSQSLPEDGKEPDRIALPDGYELPGSLDENLIELDNGQYGYLIGYDYDDQPVIYYFDAWEAGFDPTAHNTPEEIEFTVKERIEEKQAKGEGVDVVPNMSIKETPLAEEDQPVRRVVHFAPSKDDPNFIVEQQVSEEEVDDDIINLSELYDPTLELSKYQKPPIELLADHSRRVNVSDEELVENKNRIIGTLENFGIKIDTIEATIGPTVTLYEIIPAPGVRISKIKNLEDDIALSLSALGIRIIAPIPGKGTIGIEVPNKDKEVVSMYSVVKSSKFHDTDADLPVALGKTIQNETFVFDLAKMPHLLVAGATGQGKSVGLNAIITSLLYKKHPAELKFVLVDPKKVELTLYQRLEKHFLAKLPDSEEAILTDTQKVIYTFNSICIEMDNRYDLLKAAKVRNIKEYNEKFINRRLNPNKGHRYLPYFVVIVDEFADLIMTAGREIETPIARVAQLARAVGIHLIIATQRPTTNIITGVIKANFPARIAFKVTSMIDSRTILDQPGANQLVGRGDMLVSTGSEITRVQCAFIDTPEVQMITDHIGNQKGYPNIYELPEYVPEGDSSSSISEDLARRDSLFEEVARYVVGNQTGSASTIQRKFAIGFNRAGRIVDQLEAAGVLGRSEGSKPRQVLIQDPVSLENILDNL